MTQTSNYELTRGSAFPVPSEEDLVFSGRNARECERFIRAVRRHALLNGKSRDPLWMSDLVACCLEGDALRWHIQLPPDVSGDWIKLQVEMINRWPSSPIRRCVLHQ